MPFQICTHPKLLPVRTTQPSKCSLSFHICRLEFLRVRTIDVWGQIILFWQGECPVYCEVFSSIPGLYRLDISSPAPGLCLPNEVMEKTKPSTSLRITFTLSQTLELHQQVAEKFAQKQPEGQKKAGHWLKVIAYKQSAHLPDFFIKEKSASRLELLASLTPTQEPIPLLSAVTALTFWEHLFNAYFSSWLYSPQGHRPVVTTTVVSPAPRTVPGMDRALPLLAPSDKPYNNRVVSPIRCCFAVKLCSALCDSLDHR